MSRSIEDPAWQHGVRLDLNKKDKIICNYCQRVISSGVHRFKQHLAGVKGEVSACTSVPSNVKKQMVAILNASKGKKIAKHRMNEEIASLYTPSSRNDTEEQYNYDLKEQYNNELDMATRLSLYEQYQRECGFRMPGGSSSDMHGGPSSDMHGGPSSDMHGGSSSSMYGGPSSNMYGEVGGNMYQEESVVEEIVSKLPRSASIAGHGRKDPFLSKPKSQQMTLKGMVKGTRNMLGRYVGKWFYDKGIPFDAANSPYFPPMVSAIQRAGPGVKPPTAYELSGPILDEEVEEVKKWIEEYKQSWPRTGITLMSDGWLNKVSKKEFLNFLAYSPKGTAFLSSKDVSGTKKDANFYVRLYDQIVEEVGDKHVVQFITDNARACVSAGSKLMDKRKHLVWTPCAAHSIDLMLEEIGEIKIVKETLDEARLVSRFIYNHSKILFLFREHSKKKEIIRPAITRFATDYLAVDSIRQSEGALKRLFTCEEWLNDRLSKSSTGIKVDNIISNRLFWSRCSSVVEATAPLVTVLRMVDADKKATMGILYEGIERAKSAIGEKCNFASKVIEIIEKRWNTKFGRPIHYAGKYIFISLQCFSLNHFFMKL
ncbi:hypothetical protein AMTRI_Chr13g90570 [Amborella trichopoda]